MFREGLNTDQEIWATWMGSFRVSVFLCVHLWLRTNTETPPQVTACPRNKSRFAESNNLKNVSFRP